MQKIDVVVREKETSTLVLHRVKFEQGNADLSVSNEKQGIVRKIV